MEGPSAQRSGQPLSCEPVPGPRWRALLGSTCRRLAVGATGLLAALVALLGLVQLVCLILCLLALVLLAVCFLMASYPEECRQFWDMLRQMRAEARDRDA